MTDFTFATITFNHEDLIIDHLESIKYLITKYGRGYQFELVISDDCSTDDTVNCCRKWIELNRNLFEKTHLLESKKNSGIVHNCLRALNSITSSRYKLLAGDDLYYCNNIFNVLGDYDLVSSYPIALINNSVSIPITDRFIYRCSKLQYMDSVRLSKLVKKGENILYTPAVFYNSELIRDTKAQQYVSKYKYLEDVTLHYYLFALSKKKIRINYHDMPYVYYRVDSGVSQSKDNSYKKEYLKEYELFKKNIGISPWKRLLNNLNIHYYKREFHLKINELIVAGKVASPNIRRANYLKTMDNARIHLEKIRQNSIDYRNNSKI